MPPVYIAGTILPESTESICQPKNGDTAMITAINVDRHRIAMTTLTKHFVGSILSTNYYAGEKARLAFSPLFVMDFFRSVTAVS